MKNIIIKKCIEKLEQVEEYPEFIKSNVAYVKECLNYEVEVNNNMAKHISEIKKINKNNIKPI